MIKLPTKLKLRNATWHVKYSKKLLDTEGAVGLCIYANKTLHIHPDQSKDDKGISLIHEILHAIFADEIVSTKTEERIVVRMAEDLYYALKDNKLKF